MQARRATRGPTGATQRELKGRILKARLLGHAGTRVGSNCTRYRDLLGHANVSQTDTYLSAKIGGLRASMKRFDAARGKTVAKREAIAPGLLATMTRRSAAKNHYTSIAITCARSSVG